MGIDLSSMISLVSQLILQLIQTKIISKFRSEIDYANESLLINVRRGFKDSRLALYYPETFYSDCVQFTVNETGILISLIKPIYQTKPQISDTLWDDVQWIFNNAVQRALCF